MNAVVNTLHPAPPPRREIIPSPVAAMLVFVACEVMFFLGLISAHLIARSGVPDWPPAGQPRLPVAGTAFNTLVLLASGFFLFLANRRFAHTGRLGKARNWFTWSLATGLFFLVAQGTEWVRLIHFGLTIRSSMYGSFFYLIVGAHAVHALAALVLMLTVWFPLRRGVMPVARFQAAQVFWHFVVGIWPLIFAMVYLR